MERLPVNCPAIIIFYTTSFTQVPKEHEEDFKSVKKFNVFNTNNLWMKLETVQQNVQEGTLDMEIIVNPKSLGKLKAKSI